MEKEIEEMSSEDKITLLQRAMFVLSTAPSFSDEALGERVEEAFPDLGPVWRKAIYDKAGELRNLVGLGAV